MKTIQESITIDITQARCWTDSQVVLAWIRQPSQKWKVFVANRVQEIKENVSPSQWHFCPGPQNPADLLTRGEPLPRLIDNENWWKGPEWLARDVSEWPDKVAPNSEDLGKMEVTELLSEVKKTAITMTSTEVFALEERYESWQRSATRSSRFFIQVAN